MPWYREPYKVVKRVSSLNDVVDVPDDPPYGRTKLKDTAHVLRRKRFYTLVDETLIAGRITPYGSTGQDGQAIPDAAVSRLLS